MGGRGRLDGLRAAVVGPGAVGSALARDLAAAGALVRLWSRTPGRAARVRRRLARGPAGRRIAAEAELAQALFGAEAVLLAVGDEALEPAAERVAQALATGARPAALHTHGARGSEALAALARAPWV